MPRQKSSSLQTSLMWAAFAEIALAANIFTWITSPSARAEAALGVPASVTLFGASMLATLLAVIAIATSNEHSPYGRALGLTLALLAGVTFVVAIISVAASQNGTGSAGAVIALLGAISMITLATNVMRRGRSQI